MDRTATDRAWRRLDVGCRLIKHGRSEHSLRESEEQEKEEVDTFPATIDSEITTCHRMARIGMPV